MKKKNVLIIIIIILLLILFNPISFYFLYNGSKMAVGITSDSMTAKEDIYLSECNIEDMSCDKENFSNCTYENTRNCKCYECLDNFNFDSCSQCYLPAVQESFCAANKCAIPNFP